MEKRWKLYIDQYNDLCKTAINVLSGTISGYLGYVLEIRFLKDSIQTDFKDGNCIIIGMQGENGVFKICEEKELLQPLLESQSYSIYVGENIFSKQNQMIVIKGYDALGVLYGCIDFCNKYIGQIGLGRGDLFYGKFFEEAFHVEMPKWQYTSGPATKTRAVWTWGHVIYDYRKFFVNMLKLRFNEVVIWNDVVPLNANDIVEYAHKLGIKVIWGFAWGWGMKCDEILKSMNEERLQSLKENVLKTYETQYAHVNGDGIYFQSFTELHTDTVDGNCIAEIVCDLVNDVAAALFEEYPNLHIQFGLHATSVKTHLDILRRVDKRIYIVWEDCGAFPYNYMPTAIENFDETCALVEELLTLRGEEEKFGSVLKGMLKLDWQTFEHFHGQYILGERSENYMQERLTNKRKLWKVIQSAWFKNAEYARKMIKNITQRNKQCIIQGLIEDSMFESEIPFVAALFAELLWDPTQEMEKTMETVANYPCVKFSNM